MVEPFDAMIAFWRKLLSKLVIVPRRHASTGERTAMFSRFPRIVANSATFRRFCSRLNSRAPLSPIMTMPGPLETAS